MTTRHELLIFMDAYSRYNQISMYEPNEEHTSFIIDRGLYYYKAIPVGLKNAGATYQRPVNMMFKDLIGRSIEVYVDDMLVKSKMVGDHAEHLKQMFNILQKDQMKLNPLKCAFGVRSGKFMGFIVNQCGIEANTEKIKALLEMSFMSLTGRVVVLSRFVSRATDRCTSFFDMPKGSKRFEWTNKCEQAFQALKEHLGCPLLLSKPIEGEILNLYLAISKEAVNASLIREQEKVQ